MSNTIQGIVQTLGSRQTDFGTMYSVQVGGTYYGAGKFPPKCKEGDEVTFDVTYNGKYANIAPKTLQVVAGGAAKTTSSAPATASQSAGKDNYWENKEKADVVRQEIISRQAALNSSIAFLAVLSANDALPLSKTAKPADRLKAVEAILDHYRSKFYNDATGADAVVAVSTEAVDEEEGDDEWTPA